MTLERGFEVALGMDDATWRRHANPWSVWTRATVLPLVIVAVWSRAWLGAWCLVPVGLSVFWMWLNPRVFSTPRSTDHWASRGVLGERVWLNRSKVPVPPHHRLAPYVLHTITALGTVFCVWGLIDLAFWPTLLGAVLIYCGKLWFLDRMTWLFREMQDRPEYRSWLY
jgi:Family of unknown function (DUF6653)